MVEEDLKPLFLTLTQMIVVILHVFLFNLLSMSILSLAQVCRWCQDFVCAPSFLHDGRREHDSWEPGAVSRAQL